MTDTKENTNTNTDTDSTYKLPNLVNLFITVIHL